MTQQRVETVLRKWLHPRGCYVSGMRISGGGGRGGCVWVFFFFGEGGWGSLWEAGWGLLVCGFFFFKSDAQRHTYRAETLLALSKGFYGN